MPSNIILQQTTYNWPCYRNLKVLKISHEFILSLKHSALDLCVRFISQMVSKLKVTGCKLGSWGGCWLFLFCFVLYFKEQLFNNQISPSINLQNPSLAAHLHCLPSQYLN